MKSERMVPVTNLIDYISFEEHNLLVSVLEFKNDMVVFDRLDLAFQQPVSGIEVNEKDSVNEVIVALYLFAHYHLYFSFSTLYRCHLGDSLHSTRKAIDASLTAYRLLTQPETLPQYVEGHGSYNRITRTVARARELDATSYPLAPELLHLHGICSEIGSHADITGFVHRIRIKEVDATRSTFEHLMFQKPDDPHEFRYYITSTMLAFIKMLRIFQPRLVELNKKMDAKKWEEEIVRIHDGLVTEVSQLQGRKAEKSAEQEQKGKPVVAPPHG